jgi:uncharacterized OB-fold protein
VTTTTTPPDLRPVPVPDEYNRFYWDAAAAHRLVLQRCDRCARFQYPPDVVCVHCQSVDMTPTELSGRGTLYSFAVLDRSFHPGWTTPPSYVVALVELDEQPGLRMLTNVVDIGEQELAVGMPMEVTFEERPQITVPQFRPVVS